MEEELGDSRVKQTGKAGDCRDESENSPTSVVFLVWANDVIIFFPGVTT